MPGWSLGPRAVSASSDDDPRGQTSFFDTVRISRQITEDAVVVIPGIMGTELFDTTTNKLVWGLRPRALARMLMSPTGLSSLAIQPETPSPIKAHRLLRFPTLMPGLGGIEPYTRLVTRLREVVRHPSAVLEFGYDWRLPVTSHAAQLAVVVDDHLRWWRERSGRPHAKVHLVAHSMGGLLCRTLASIPGAMDEVSSVVTLGTPFEGAAKAAIILAAGHGTPIRAPRLQPVAVTLPGIYDLLPSYRCVDTGTEAFRLTPTDVGAVGANAEMARTALTSRAHQEAIEIPNHRPLIGIGQPTICSLSLDAGRADPRYYTFGLEPDGSLKRDSNGGLVRLVGTGDGTVPRNSALPIHNRLPALLPQQHGALAQTDEAIAFVIDRALHNDTGQRLGKSEIGICAPDMVAAGEAFEVEIMGDAHEPNDIRTTVFDADNGLRVSSPMAQRRDGQLTVGVVLGEPGLYRIAVAGAGTSPVTQLVLAAGHKEGG